MVWRGCLRCFVYHCIRFVKNSLLTLMIDSFCSSLFLRGLSYHNHNRFTALFPGPPGWAIARREPLDFMVQGKINRGRHTDHLAGRHSIRTKQCPPPPFPHFYSVLQCSTSYGSSICSSVGPSVHLSACLSHAGIVSKRLHVARCSLHCQIAKCV